MAEKPPPFVVVDKRKFTAEGEIREGFVAPEVEEQKAAPVSEPEEFSSAKVVTMPVRTPEAASDATRQADDLSDEDMNGSLEPIRGAALEVNGNNLRSEDDFAGDFADDFAGDEPIGQPRSAAETAAQNTAYRKSTETLDTMLREANPGVEAPGAVAFEHVIQSFYLSAIMAMGAGTEPGQKPRIDIIGARQSIDMLSVLEEKTRGNLSEREQQLLQGIKFELRMMFLELTNAISKQAHQPGMPPQGGGGLR